MNQLSQQLLDSSQGLVEITRPPFISKFSKAFQLHYVNGDLTSYFDKFYPEDFLFIDCSYSPLSSASQFELYRFWLLLDKERVLALSTPIFHHFLKHLYSNDYRITETNCLNPMGLNIHS